MRIKKKICIITITCLLSMLFAGMGGAALADASSGLVAEYNLDGNLNDSVNGNNGTAMGNITYTSGPLGQAAVFDGKSYIEVNDSDAQDLGSQFSISAWVYNSNTDKWGGILEKQKSEYGDEVDSYSVYYQGMWPAFQFYDKSGNIGVGGNQSTKRIDANEWDLLTVTFDGNSIDFYKDGELLCEDTNDVSGGGQGLGTSDGKLRIGFVKTNDGDDYFKGMLDDLRLYNRSLSQDDIKELYSAGATGANKELVAPSNKMVAYYSFNGDLKDHSGFGNDAVSDGSPVKFVDSAAAKGAYFGGHSYLEVNNSDSLQVDKGFTASAWVKLDKTDNYWEPILSSLKASNNTNGDAYDFAINSSYTPNYQPEFNFTSFIEDSGNDSQNSSFSDKVVAPATWAMVTVSYDGSKVRYYLNGKLYSSMDADGNQGPICHSVGKLEIGHILDRGDQSFAKGIIDELRIYNYTLNDAAIKTLATFRDSLQVAPATKVTLIALKVKQSVQLAAKLSTYVYTPSATAPGTGTNSFNVTALTKGVAYKSSNAKVAAVSTTGKITALKKGTAVITATYGQLSTSVTVTVK